MPDTLTIDALVRARSAAHGAKPMVIDPGTRLGYAELEATSRDLAAVLIDAGVGKAPGSG
ncbi:hypothetical protein C1Y40_05529 [Mycobacterium talmoniae]|uniref:Uncharacterized protein n=1 Tax=Mycobacterium talmoniae TaxID=1858794 RepID=A0A2S8BCE2_9MYCO|nr:hypothetical protein C1Y40_05529 [Mycobacterium talmoniae]